MRVGIIQSSFIPWRGFFDFIASVDLFVFYEDVQYSKNGWRNRNRIKTAEGLQWLTVPVRVNSLSQLIQDTEIDDRQNWRVRHFSAWSKQYSQAPYLADIQKILGDMGQGKDRTISQLNIRLIQSICDYLGIKTPMRISSEWELKGSKTDRLLDLLMQVGADSYLSGPAAEDYLEKDKFSEAGIALMYKTYDYEPYPQLWGAFEGGVSVLDLIANRGPQSINWIRSQSLDKMVVNR